MAHLSRNISDSENPVVSYQPSWFDDGAAAQLHRVSQLRWIDLYIYISIIARRWFGTCVAGSYRWAAGLLENPHHQNRWFSQRYTSILSGDFPSSHVWLRRACLKILGGHPPFPRPCGGRQPIFTKKKKNCARQVGARTESLHANCDKETLQPLTNLTNPQMLPWFPRISVWLQPWRFSPRGLKNGKEYPSSHPPLEQEGTMKNDRVTLTSIMNFP